MSKQSKIKWREEDTKELARVVKNFNAKLNRLIKKNPENSNILPSFYNEKTKEFENRISLEQLKGMISTRQDLNRELNALKRFSKRGAEMIVDAPDNDYGSRTTKWQRTEMNRRIGVINRRRKNRLDTLNEVEMANASGKLGYTVGQVAMGSASKNALNPMKSFTPGMNQNDIKWKFRAIMNESRSEYFNEKDERLRQNYIRSLEENYRGGDITGVVNVINGMDINEFLLKFEAKGDAFEFSYPPDEDQYQAYLSELRSYWTPSR